MAAREVDAGTLQELTALLAAIKDSATPGLAERISQILVSLGIPASAVDAEKARDLVETTMQTSDALVEAMRQLDVWYRSGVWSSLTEMTAVLTALRDSATPHMVERLAEVAGGWGAIAAQAGPGVASTVDAVETHGDELARVIHQVGQWQHDGTWDALTDFIVLARGLRDSVTPHVMERLTTLMTAATETLTAGMDSGLLDISVRAADALSSAKHSAEKDPTRITATGLFRSLKDPEIQRGLKVMMAFLRQLPDIID